MNVMLKQVLLGQLRHLLTAGATWLVTVGYLDASMVDSLVGIVVYIIVAGWSAFEKKETVK